LFKFIHTADIHLDSPLHGLERYEGAPVDEIRGATRRALENLVDLAIREQVDFVIVAGDVYDGDWKDHNTGLFFVAQMSRLRDRRIPVIMISGNHDSANKMTKSLRLPDNVEVLSHKEAQTATTPRLAELGIAIHGRSFGNAAEFDNMVLNYPPKQSGCFNIGVLHTSLNGAEGHAPYAPCTLDDLRRKQYDYWALGHVHTRAEVSADPPVIFCGNLQGRHIRETGPKGCYVVTVDDAGKVQAEFTSLDVFRWDLCTVGIENALRIDDVFNSLSKELSQAVRRNENMPLAVRIIVTGRTCLHDHLLSDPIRWTNEFRALALQESQGNLWIEKVKFQTFPTVVADAEAAPDGPLGALASYLKELSADDEQLVELSREFADLFRKLPGELFQDDDSLSIEKPAVMRRWLSEVGPLLLNRVAEGAQP